MIRNATLLTLLTAAALGLAVFALKYKVQALEATYTDLNREIIGNRQAMHVLRAEWSHLNEPQRLKELADRHLDLKLVTPAHVGTFAALPPERARDEPTAGPQTVAEVPRAPASRAVPSPRKTETSPPPNVPRGADDEFARIVSQALADRRSSR